MINSLRNSTRDISIFPGDTASYHFQIFGANGEIPNDLDSFTVVAKLKRSWHHEDDDHETFVLVSSISGSIVSVSFTEEQTKLLLDDRMIFQVQISDGTDTKTVISGIIFPKV